MEEKVKYTVVPNTTKFVESATRLGRDWLVSKSLVSHNCNSIDEVNTEWCHCARWESPLKCRGCGTECPRDIEAVFRILENYKEKK